MFGGLKNIFSSPASTERPITPPPFDENPCVACPDPCDHPRVPSYLLKKIAFDQPLEGTVQKHHRQVLVCTGLVDWPAKFDTADGSLVQAFVSVSQKLKEGTYKWADEARTPKNLKMAVAATSRPTEPVRAGASCNPAFTQHEQQRAEDVILLPEGLLVPRVSPTTTAVEALIQVWLGSGHEYNSDALVRALGARRVPYSWLVVICAHKRRDKRCGVIGPLIGETFETILKRKNIFLPPDALSMATVAEAPCAEMGALSLKDSTAQSEIKDGDTSECAQKPREGAITHNSVGVLLASHTGGHKFAGNVIVYPGGIWYGRVTPCNVPTIVERHIEGGKVVREIYRGCSAGPEHGRTVGW